MAQLYTVTNIRRVTRMLANGNFVEVMEVSFTTPSGVASSIDVPLEHFLVDQVRELLEAEARKIEAIMKL